MRLWPMLLTLTSGCAWVTEQDFRDAWDKDGDGWPGVQVDGVLQDCDDTNPHWYPGALDLRGDGCDSDCGFSPDADGDDWPDDQDCAPNDPNIFPCNPAEVDGDGIDSDCDGLDGVRWLDCPTGDPYYPDSTVTQVDGCDQEPWGTGTGDKPALDKDGDGYGPDTDCDDNDASVHPGATEVCNGKDDNCDGQIDVDAIDGTPYFADSDSDGYGEASSGVTACAAPDGYVDNDDDCDDTNPAVHPGATELCNGVDDDCDGVIDGPDLDESTSYRDADGDGFGDPADSVTSCAIPAGYVANDADCDDGDADRNPAAPEVCNGADDNCDGRIDEEGAIGESTYWVDFDGDGYGSSDLEVTACAMPAGYAENDADCDDDDAATHPGATDVCGDGIDQDCNGIADDGCGPVTFSTSGFSIQDFDVDLDGGVVAAGGSTTGLVYAQCFEPSGASTQPAVAIGSYTGTPSSLSVRRNRVSGGSVVTWREVLSATPLDARNWVAFIDADCNAVTAQKDVDPGLPNKGAVHQARVAIADDGSTAIVYQHEASGAHRLLRYDRDGNFVKGAEVGKGECALADHTLAMGMNHATGDVVLACESAVSGGGGQRIWRRYKIDLDAIDSSWITVPGSGTTEAHKFNVAMNDDGEFAWFGLGSSGAWLANFWAADGSLAKTLDVGSGGSTQPRTVTTVGGDFVFWVASPAYQWVRFESNGNQVNSGGEREKVRLDGDDTVYTQSGSDIISRAFSL